MWHVVNALFSGQHHCTQHWSSYSRRAEFTKTCIWCIPQQIIGCMWLWHCEWMESRQWRCEPDTPSSPARWYWMWSLPQWGNSGKCHLEIVRNPKRKNAAFTSTDAYLQSRNWFLPLKSLVPTPVIWQKTQLLGQLKAGLFSCATEVLTLPDCTHVLFSLYFT